jgi:O-antigen/teichoic acid export membrane protein
MTFLKNFWITGFTTLIITILAFFNNIIVTRTLGPEGRGVYAVISNLVIFLALIFGEGIRRSNTILAGKNENLVRTLFLQTLIYSLLIFILFSISYFFKFLYYNFLPNISSLLLSITFLITIMTILWQSNQAIFLGLQKILEFNILSFVQVACFLLINILGIWLFNFELEEIILSLFLSGLITFIISLFYLKSLTFNSKEYEKVSLKQVTFLGIKSTYAAGSMFLTLRSTIFFINFFLNPFQTGIYAVAALFSEIMQKVPNVLGAIVISKTVSDNSNKPADDSTRIVRMVFLFNLIVVVALFFLGGIIIKILFGTEFLSSFMPLKLLLPAILFLGPGAILYSYYMGKAFPSAILWINGLVSIIHILLNLLFVPIYGIYAASLICSITYFIWSTSIIILFHIDTKKPITEILFCKKEDFAYLSSAIKNKGLIREK